MTQRVKTLQERAVLSVIAEYSAIHQENVSANVVGSTLGFSRAEMKEALSGLRRSGFLSDCDANMAPDWGNFADSDLCDLLEIKPDYLSWADVLATHMGGTPLQRRDQWRLFSTFRDIVESQRLSDTMSFVMTDLFDDVD